METRTNLEELTTVEAGQDLASWNRPRSSDELRDFINRRQNEINQENCDFDFDGVLA